MIEDLFLVAYLGAYSEGFLDGTGMASTSCRHCGKLFYTGHKSGRTAKAQYCSDRCRVAASRARRAAA